MSRSAEFDSSSLEAAYLADDVVDCYNQLAGLAPGTELNIGGVTMELARPRAIERDILIHSRRIGQEIAVVANDTEQCVIHGEATSISVDDFFPPLHRLFNTDRSQAGIFSHTHPSRKLHPFPSWGDVFHWRMVEASWPNIENRIVFLGNTGIQAFRYIRFDGELFADNLKTSA